VGDRIGIRRHSLAPLSGSEEKRSLVIQLK
jgi:hypothetical protein